MEPAVKDAEEAQRAASRARNNKITNACEACRAAKVKCQASNQLGICKRYRTIQSSLASPPLRQTLPPSVTLPLSPSISLNFLLHS